MSSEHSLMSQPESPSSHGNPSPSTTNTTATTGSGDSGGKRDKPHLQVTRNKSLSRKRARPSTTAKEQQEADTEGKQSLLESIPQIGELFEVVSKIGEGTFSSVYLATLREDSESQFAIKHLVPTSSSARMENEIYCLEKMGGRDHVISLFTDVRHRDHVALILPYFKHDKFVDYLPLLGLVEVRCYVKALFEALRNVHSHGIIHRDIKPSNFLYNRTTRRFQLVDFGLAHLQAQTKEDRGSILKAIQSKGCGSGTDSTQNSSSMVRPRGSTANPASKRPHPVAPPTTQPKQMHQRTVSRPMRQPLRANKLTKSSGVNPKRPSSTVPAAMNLPSKSGGGGGREVVRICSLRHKVNSVCKFCLGRSNQVAPRAGTPGFRPPEVLLKYPHQTTAVDMWSAGVILLCLLSGRYPFFKAHDDMSAMAQIVGLFGSEKCIQAAKSYKKDLICEPLVLPLDLRDLCSSLRATISLNDSNTTSCDQRHQPDSSTKKKSGSRDQNGPADREESHSSPCKRRRLNSRSRTQSLEPTVPCHSSTSIETESADCHSSSWNQVPESLYDLMLRCLDLNPLTRITAEQALCHEFLAEKPKR